MLLKTRNSVEVQVPDLVYEVLRTVYNQDIVYNRVIRLYNLTDQCILVLYDVL